jgi:predicted MFS family arabinose efflux permease
VLLGLTVVLAIAALAVFWAPAMAMLSDAAEETGLDQALAFSISNLAWAAGHMIGAGAGGTIADATGDAVPYAGLGLACALTFVGLSVGRRRAAATAG